jgi:hypothetical protein
MSLKHGFLYLNSVSILKYQEVVTTLGNCLETPYTKAMIADWQNIFHLFLTSEKKIPLHCIPTCTKISNQTES